MKKPVILINFKAYDTSFGKKGIDIAKKIEKISLEYSTEIIISVPPTEIYRISNEVSIPVYAEHVDANPLGAHTGSVTPEMVKDAGAKGTLINHSERRIRIDEIAEILSRARKLNLDTVVCVDRNELVKAIGTLEPTSILIEPPELIGSGISVSKARPEVITNAVEQVKEFPKVLLIAGAGITNGEDVSTALKLGAAGIGVASAVMKAKEPCKVVEEFVKSSLGN
jgi:triosephosphate isomerase